MVNKFLYYWRE